MLRAVVPGRAPGFTSTRRSARQSRKSGLHIRFSPAPAGRSIQDLRSATPRHRSGLAPRRLIEHISPEMEEGPSGRNSSPAGLARPRRQFTDALTPRQHILVASLPEPLGQIRRTASSASATVGTRRWAAAGAAQGRRALRPAPLVPSCGHRRGARRQHALCRAAPRSVDLAGYLQRRSAGRRSQERRGIADSGAHAVSTPRRRGSARPPAPAAPRRRAWSTPAA